MRSILILCFVSLSFLQGTCQQIEIKTDSASKSNTLIINGIEYQGKISLKKLTENLGNGFTIKKTDKYYFRDPRHRNKHGHKSYYVVFYDSLGIGFKGSAKNKLDEFFVGYARIEKSMTTQVDTKQPNEISKSETAIINYSHLIFTSTNWLPQNCIADSSPLRLLINGTEVNTTTSFNDVVVQFPDTTQKFHDPAIWTEQHFNLPLHFINPSPVSDSDRAEAIYPHKLYIQFDQNSKKIFGIRVLLIPIK